MRFGDCMEKKLINVNNIILYFQEGKIVDNQVSSAPICYTVRRMCNIYTRRG